MAPKEGLCVGISANRVDSVIDEIRGQPPPGASALFLRMDLPNSRSLLYLVGPADATRPGSTMSDDREDVFSKAVRAGKRTYFFDVKSTRGRDLYLTITESKKHTHEDGTAHYDKHKIFLYKEDFDKFLDGLKEAFGEIDRLKSSGEYIADEPVAPRSNEDRPPYTDVNFEDLDRKDI